MNFHERAPFAVARMLVKLVILLKIRDAPLMVDKISMA